MSLNGDRLLDMGSRNGHGQFPEGYWRQHPDYPDEWYKIRPIDYDWRNRLYEKHSRVGRNGERQLKGDRETQFFKELMDYLIEDWEIYWDVEQTRPVECTREAKFGIHKNYRTSRGNWVWEEAVLLQEDDEVRTKAEEENFRRAHPPTNGKEPELSGLSRVIQEG